jgi:hypothetical protein
VAVKIAEAIFRTPDWLGCDFIFSLSFIENCRSWVTSKHQAGLDAVVNTITLQRLREFRGIL